MFNGILEKVSESNPIVHCITNYVTVNDCANIILATGASPIMADDINEVEDIVSLSGALVINMGTLNNRTIQSMVLAGKSANARGVPVVLDPVGAGASHLRNETLKTLLEKIHFSVIRGNISEIRAVSKGSGTTRGVDADAADRISDENLDEVILFTKDLSKKTGAVIAISGAIDLVCDENRAYIIRNGHPIMSKITGSGCMLTTVIGSFIGANPNRILDATACAVCAMGICGERAYHEGMGTATFRMNLIDEMSLLNEDKIKGGMRVEVR